MPQNVPQCPAVAMLLGWDIAHPAALGGFRTVESGTGPRGGAVAHMFSSSPIRHSAFAIWHFEKAPHSSHGIPYIAPAIPCHARACDPQSISAACDSPPPSHLPSHPVADASSDRYSAAISCAGPRLRAPLSLRRPSRSCGARPGRIRGAAHASTEVQQMVDHPRQGRGNLLRLHLDQCPNLDTFRLPTLCTVKPIDLEFLRRHRSLHDPV